MALSLEKIQRANELLRSYNGDNPFILRTRNTVVGHQTRSMNDFECEYVIENHDREPRLINKIVKISDWYGQSLKEQWNTEFTPDRFKITWYLGETPKLYHFFCIYRKSQEKAVEVFAPKRGVLTDFLSEDWSKKEIDFVPYNEKLGFNLYPHQEEAVRFLTTRKKAILAHEMGFGKMEPVSSLIPTPFGYKKMGDIKVGDKVFGSDGKEHNVIGIFPHKNKPIYKVTFTDESFCRCGMEHLWIVKTPNDKVWKVKSLEEIAKSGLEWKNSHGHTYKYKIPLAEPINYNNVNHLIHPYILGICIGDGNMCNCGINISIPDSEIETSVKIKSLLNENYTLSENRSGSCPRYRIVKSDRSNNNAYINEIKRLGLNVHGNEKFIPDEYKIDSVSNRIELLRGLMDSDGSISYHNKIRYSTNSERLANDVCELVTSLGGVARVHLYKRERNGLIMKEYTVIIQIKINPFSLKRKADRYNPTFKKYCVRKIKSVEYDGNEDAQCIAVDSEDHSYVTSKYHIVTHNTIAAIVSALEGGFNHVLIVSPSSVKETWKRELMHFVDDEDVTVVQGSNWDDARFTIINYDILDNFYHLPEQTIKTRELNVDDDGNVFRETKEKKIVARSKKIIDEAMATSQLFQGHYDLLIIDEAHRLSNSTSNRFKIMQDFIRRAKPDGIFELTGTMVTNTTKNLYNLLKLIDVPITKDWQYFMERYCGARFFFKKNERNAYTAMFCKSVGKREWSELSYDEKGRLNEYLEKNCKKICIPGEDTNMEELQEIIKPYYLRRVKDDLDDMVPKTVKYLHYEMSADEKESYDELWEEYLELQEDKEKTEKNKRIIEVSLMRQWLADKMIPRTVSLVRKCIEKNHKVIIFCTYDNEIEKFREEFSDCCVFHNGKISEKKKSEAVDRFQNDDGVKVFVGNIFSAGVGLTLTEGSVVVFNCFSFTPSDNLQAEDRIHRIGQTKPCTVYYQSFNGTYFDRMLEIVHDKQEVIDKIVVSEKEK